MGKGHVELVEYVSIIHDSLDANMNYLHRQIFGTLPHNLDEEYLVNPQVSSLNLLKAQRARKTANTGKVANAPSAKHTASVRTGHGIAMAFAQHSSTPKARDPLQSSSSEKCAQPSEREDQSWNFEDDQPSLQKHLPSRHRATVSGDPGQRKVAPRRHPSTPSRGGSTLPHSSTLTDRLFQMPSSETPRDRPPLLPIQLSESLSNPQKSSHCHSSSILHPGHHLPPCTVQESQLPSRKQLEVPQPHSSPLSHHLGASWASQSSKVLPPATARWVRIVTGMLNLKASYLISFFSTNLNSLLTNVTIFVTPFFKSLC